jgi:glutamate-1-semialdehyde aminotransferase
MSFNDFVIQNVYRPQTSDGQDIWFSGAEGAILVGRNGEQWIDFDNSKGSVMLGHASPPVVAAVDRAIRGYVGANTGPSEVIAKVAQSLVKTCDGEVVAFFKTGTSAVRAIADAVRIVTERKLILSSGYHGYDPYWYPVKELFEPNQYGVIDFFFNLNQLEKLIERYTNQIAGAIISPDHLYLGKNWYERANLILQGSNIPVIVDDVKQGYRYHPGISVKNLGWKPIASVVSKGIANGYPLAAVVGTRDVLAPLEVYTYTAFFEPVAFAAAEATLQLMSSGDVQQSIYDQGNIFIEHCKQCFHYANIPIEIIGNGNLFQFVCANKELQNKFYDIALKNGLLFYRGDNQCPSLAFTNKIVQEACQKIENCITELANFKDLCSAINITLEERYEAAWNVMDGLPDFDLDETTVFNQLVRLVNTI